MSKNPKRSDSQPVQELSLEALDVVMGGSAPPMGLGGSIMPSPLHQQSVATTSASTGVGYTDHFNVGIGGMGGHGSHGPATSAEHAAAGAASASMGAAMGPQAGGVQTAEPGPLGLGSNSAGGHAMVNATSAFQLVEQAAPQDAQAQTDAQPQDASAAALPEGLGGNS